MLEYKKACRKAGFSVSALAGSPNVLPFGERKSTRYAGEIRGLSKKHHLSDIMTSVQAVKKQKKGDALWQTV